MTKQIQAAEDDQVYGNATLDPSEYATVSPSKYATVNTTEHALLRAFLVKVATQPKDDADTSRAAHAMRRLRQEAETIHTFIRRNYD